MVSYPYKHDQKTKQKLSMIKIIKDMISWEKRLVLNQIILSMLAFVVIFVFKFSTYNQTRQVYRFVIESTQSDRNVEYIKNIIK